MYGVARDDIQSREVGDHLQHRAHIDVLEVERKLLTLVTASRTLRELVRVFLDRLDLDDELVVRLIGRVLPQALRLDHHPRVAALRERIHRDDGRNSWPSATSELDSQLHYRHRQDQPARDHTPFPYTWTSPP